MQDFLEIGLIIFTYIVISRLIRILFIKSCNKQLKLVFKQVKRKSSNTSKKYVKPKKPFKSKL